MSSIDLNAAALRTVQELCGPGVQPTEIKITLNDGRKIVLPYVQPCSSVPIHPDSESCEADIREILEDAGQRLTTMQILAALDRAGKLWGESTVKRKLAEMVRDGQLTNEKERRPRGYGLPQWQD